jgi:hypothetical protein
MPLPLLRLNSVSKPPPDAIELLAYPDSLPAYPWWIDLYTGCLLTPWLAARTCIGYLFARVSGMRHFAMPAATLLRETNGMLPISDCTLMGSCSWRGQRRYTQGGAARALAPRDFKFGLQPRSIGHAVLRIAFWGARSAHEMELRIVR